LLFRERPAFAMLKQRRLEGARALFEIQTHMPQPPIDREPTSMSGLA
jgi:hypothetical protein